MALTKVDMAECLFNELGLNKREAREFVDHMFEELRLSLEFGETVKLSGFATSTSATRRNDRDETRRRVPRRPSRPGGWLPSARASS